MKHYGIPKKCLLICLWYTTVNNAPAPSSTRGPLPSRQPQCHCPSRWKRPSCWLSWWLWWRLCWLWWRLCWARRLPMPRKSLPVRWGQNQSLPTLGLEVSQAVSLTKKPPAKPPIWGLGACHLGHGEHVEKPPATNCRCNCLCTKPTFMRLQNVRAKEVPFHRCSFNAQYRQRMRQTYWWKKNTTVNNAFLNILNWKYICQPACGSNCMYFGHFSARIIELFDASLEAEWRVLILK